MAFGHFCTTPTSLRAQVAPALNVIMDIEQAFEISLLQLEKHGFECIREPERVMATIWAVEAEVNNGGFDQLFYNSAGDISFYASIALKSIGADSMARIAEEALSIFGSSGAPRDCRERQEILISFGEKYEDKLEALDLEFTEYPDDVQELMEAYVEINF